MNILKEATKLLRPKPVVKEHKPKSGLEQIIQAQFPSGYDKKLPLTIVKEEVVQQGDGLMKI